MELTIEAALQKGVEAHKAGKVQEADQYYTAVLNSQPNHPDANHNMGVLAVGVGQVDKSLPFFKKALEVNSTITQFWISYIDALMKLEQFEDAKAVLTQAKENGLNDDRFDIFKASLKSQTIAYSDVSQEEIQSITGLYAQGKFQEALNSANQSLGKFPNSVTLNNISGAIYAALQDYDAALERYKRAIELKPDYAEAHTNMGIVLHGTGEIASSIKNHEKAIEINPNFFEAYNNLGNVLRDIGRLDEAIRNYDKAIELKPDFSQAYYNVGIAWRDKGNPKKAAENYKNAIKITPNFYEHIII